MSVVIIGGHDCMKCKYTSICGEYGCKAKVYTRPESDLGSKIGSPDLIVLFTNPVSHKMAKIAKKKAVTGGIPLIQSHTGSSNALKNILAEKLVGAFCE